ncbi:ABC transporter substrate-binding protein [Paenibacillus sp. NEAU-GSW1]|nr:ABC transporter substrate-binding protein [Paenibacillus sp. NEAU-GSW1]
MTASLLLALSAGCTGVEKPTRQEQRPAQTKDELLLAIGAEPEDGFDPTTGWGRYGSPMFQSTLFKRSSDMSIANDIGEKYSISEDGKQWTVQLRGGVKFSDGHPLTAADVKFTFETAAGKGSTVDVTNVADISTNGDYEIIFTLHEPQSTFITLLTTLGIVPKHAYSGDYAQHPIGSGPYKLIQWDKGQQVIVAYNDLYYGDKPFFKKMTFLFLSEDAAFAAAKSGQVDVAYIPSAFSKQSVNGMHVEAVKSVDNRGIMLPFVLPGGKTELGHPIGNAVTADLAIRQAVNYAIDRAALVEGILEGYGTPAYTVNDGLPWWNPDTVFEDGDIGKAAKLLAEGGWKDSDGDGIVEKNGMKAKFTLLYPAGDMNRQSLALAVADMVKAAGIQIEASGKSWDDIGKLMYSNAVLFGFGSQDPIEMYNLYSSKFRGVDYYNSGYYSNAAVDGWFEKALLARNERDAMEYWKKAQWDGTTGVGVQGDAAWAWLVNIDHLYVVKDGLDIGKQKIHPHGHGWPITDNIEEWRWLNE